jgi:hypothetical protein
VSVLFEAGLISTAAEQSCVEKLAQLFSTASPVRIPVRISTVGTTRSPLQEHTMIEFGTSHEALFSSTLPLEFEDQVQITGPNVSLHARATVVAVRYHGGEKAVAVRFADKVENWVISS